MGVPEASEEKWLALAKHTGIEIHVVGFEWDKAKVAGSMAVALTSGLPKDKAGLEKLWSARCAEPGRICADPNKFVRTKFDYNVGVRPPDAPKDEFFQMHLSKLDHDRMLYYRYLHERNLFDKTIAELDAPQFKLVKAEENRILAEAMGEAHSLIAQAKAQAFEQAFKEMARKERQFREAQQVSRASQQPAPVNARPIATTFFVDMLPRIKDFAVASCRAPGQVPLTQDITRPFENIQFIPSADDREADRLAIGIGDCEGLLFRRLIDVIRRGKGYWINNEWLRDVAGGYKAPTAPLKLPPPPLHVAPPPSRGRPCESYGNIRCP